MPQTSINPLGQPAAVAGLIADNSENVDLVAGFSEEASASIPFGVVVKQGTAPQGVLNMTSSEDTLVGVVAQDYTHAPGAFGDIDAAGVGLVPDASMKILRKGRIWMVIDNPTVPLVISPNVDRPFARYTTNAGVGTVVGAVSNVTDAGKNTDMTKVGVFRSPATIAADGVTPIAIVEWDFTNKP